MTPETLSLLLRSPEALAAAAARMPTEASFLRDFDHLRKRFPPDLAKAALESAILRIKARDKFPEAEKLFFERESLEQATHHVVATHRALRFGKYRRVLDIGCGLGADSIALARAGCEVIALEVDPLRARLAAANFAALMLNVRVIEVTALSNELPEADAVFCDPARRSAGRRHLASDEYSPAPMDVIARFPNRPIGFKLAPGISWNDLNRFGGEVEFVSLDGELKECRLWLGELATVDRRATVLPAGKSLTGVERLKRILRPPGLYIYIPDASVTRAGLEHVLAERLNATFLDATQPLLTADAQVLTPFAEAYRFDALATGSADKLKACLRERNVGRVTCINIGSLLEIEAVRKSLKLSGDGDRTLLFTRLDGAAATLVVDRIDGSATGNTL